MTRPTDTTGFDATGPEAPPMANGELVFEAPWQGRIFGMATHLAEQGVYAWDDFRARLIARIAAWEGRSQREYDLPLLRPFPRGARGRARRARADPTRRAPGSRARLRGAPPRP